MFSGMLLTLFINGMLNVILLMMSFLHTVDPTGEATVTQLMKCLQKFDENTSAMTMGDDNTVTISEEFKEVWNFQHVRSYCKSIGMKYTPADKSDGDGYFYEPTVRGDGSRSYNICKREFRWDEERQRYACPLEMKSIGKMLTIGLKSQLDSVEQQEVNIQTAVYELAQHGRDVYNSVCSRLRLALEPRYSKLFCEKYDDVITKIEGHDFFPWGATSEMESGEAKTEIESGVIGSLFFAMKHGKREEEKPSRDGKSGYLASMHKEAFQRSQQPDVPSAPMSVLHRSELTSSMSK